MQQTGVEQGYLVIGDISGYTSFMADNELEHSQEIMSELLTLVLEQFTPRMTLSEVEGDAVFVYGSVERLDRGETLLEMIERAYVAFRDQLSSMQRATTCDCRACQSIPKLDLKFITHFGDYALQSIAGRCKVVGSNVNLIHRLLKNTVAESTGWNAYALFTCEALEAMKTHPVRMHPSSETYEHLGTIDTYSLNLNDRYLELTDQRRIVVEDDDAHLILQYQFQQSPETVWEWLNNPERRNVWLEGTHWSIQDRPDGRTGPGTIAHCAHGGGLTVEKILDWRPFSYLTCEGTSGPFQYRMTTWLVAEDDGCQLRILCQMTKPRVRGIFRGVGTFVFKRIAKMNKGYEKLQEILSVPANVPEKAITEAGVLAA